MERDVATQDNIRAYVETKNRIYKYVLERTRDHQMAEEVVRDVFLSLIEHARRRGSAAEVETLAGYVIVAARNALRDRLRRRSPAVGGRHTVELAGEPDSSGRAAPREPPEGGSTLEEVLASGGREIIKRLKQQQIIEAADSTPPEIAGMLDKILDAGGSQIVDRLKEQDAKIKDAPCHHPEIGGLIDTHYVPLLLSVLELDDEEFDAEYPGDSPVSSQQREAFAAAIQAHSQDCARCSVKFSSDMAWDEHVSGVFERAKHRLRIYV